MASSGLLMSVYTQGGTSNRHGNNSTSLHHGVCSEEDAREGGMRSGGATINAHELKNTPKPKSKNTKIVVVLTLINACASSGRAVPCGGAGRSPATPRRRSRNCLYGGLIAVWTGGFGALSPSGYVLVSKKWLGLCLGGSCHEYVVLG